MSSLASSGSETLRWPARNCPATQQSAMRGCVGVVARTCLHVVGVTGSAVRGRARCTAALRRHQLKHQVEHLRPKSASTAQQCAGPCLHQHQRVALAALDQIALQPHRNVSVQMALGLHARSVG